MGVAAFLAVASGVAQWSIALRVREYARSLKVGGQTGRDVEEKSGAGFENASARAWRVWDEKKAPMLA